MEAGNSTAVEWTGDGAGAVKKPAPPSDLGEGAEIFREVSSV